MHGILNLKNLKKLDGDEMSKGVLIYAYNGAYDYVKMARASAALAKKHLQLPVTLVTDEPVDYPEFDNVIVQPRTDPVQFKYTDGQLQPWHNQNRSTAYSITPYDQTLVIDADYFVMNKQLGNLFDTNIEFACYADANDVTDRKILEKTIGHNSIPMQWATVIYFTKNNLANGVFEFIEYIKNHYEFYSLMYNFRPDKFRNDYALSIALQTLTGYSSNNFANIPGDLNTVVDDTRIVDVRDNGEILILYPSSITRDMKVTKVKNVNLHFINKKTLVESLDKFKILYA